MKRKIILYMMGNVLFVQAISAMELRHRKNVVRPRALTREASQGDCYTPKPNRKAAFGIGAAVAAHGVYQGWTASQELPSPSRDATCTLAASHAIAGVMVMFGSCCMPEDE